MDQNEIPYASVDSGEKQPGGPITQAGKRVWR